MHLKTISSIAAAAFSFMLAATATAEKMNMSMSIDVKIHQSRSTFEPSKEHPGEEWLYLTQGEDDIEFDLRMRMSGQNDVVQKGRTKVSTVPGVTEGVSGYKRAKIETFGNEVTLVIETKLTRKKQKDGKEVEEKEDAVERIPLQFKDRAASRQGFESGKRIECRISSTGLKAMLGRAKDKQMGAINVNAAGGGAKMSASGSATLLDSRRKGTVWISPQQIQYEAPPMRIRGEGKVRVNT
ncbi:MAG TPA: hypothetical protein VN673_15705 [Clostridia bacterium]|nr:hypothetical protein [Clostridia bacterium]